MSLREQQSLFAKLVAELILWIYSKGWEVTLADGSIDLHRKFRTEGGLILMGDDAQHMKASLHYSRLAQDLNLFVENQWVSDGSHPAWNEIGEKWESMHHLARWGGRFRDANHFSLERDGRK